MRKGVVALALVTLSSCNMPTARVTLPGRVRQPLPATIRVQVRDAGAPVVREVPLEEYVAATLLSEVDPPTADTRALEGMFEVQAIIARTYAISNRGRHGADGYDLCSTTHCQLYDPARLRTSKWAAQARDAAQRTAGEVLWYDGRAARAVFHADCGGHTSAASDVWGGAAPAYLAAERDGGPASDVHVEWKIELRRTALRDALNADARTRIGKRLDDIQIAARDSAGRAERLTLKGTRPLTVRGEVFRDVVAHAFGVKSLRSTLFTITRTRTSFSFSGKGFGHGVGLCQTGAFARIRAGATPDQVLAFYYPGTRLAAGGG